ncbi:hypothetical protein Holit_02680 [Hollandina sp. SP2]
MPEICDGFMIRGKFTEQPDDFQISLHFPFQSPIGAHTVIYLYTYTGLTNLWDPTWVVRFREAVDMKKPVLSNQGH